jgi:hypothetical protein
MGAPGAPDPARATLIEILRQLNQAEEVNAGKAGEQSLELKELEDRLSDLPPVKQGSVKVALAVGLLLRNGMLTVDVASDYSWQRQRAVAQRYRISPEGKKFLVDTIENSSRIS